MRKMGLEAIYPKPNLSIPADNDIAVLKLVGYSRSPTGKDFKAGSVPH